MHSLRGSRRLTRVVAAWLLAWFAVMQATALLRAPAGLAAAGLLPDVVGAAATDDEGQEDHARHEDHAAHAAGHEDHSGADHIAQCPGCLFSTAPPPQDFPLAQALPALAEAPAFPYEAEPRPHPLAQPPARGPPRVS